MPVEKQMSDPGLLAPEEYERRKSFLEGLTGLTKSEYIEIIRILNKYEFPYSENDNGIFFNVCNVSQELFNSLELFMDFAQINRKNLSEREVYMSTLTKLTKVGGLMA
jgi:hypothetical protein